MKKIIFCASITVMLFMGSCQKETELEDTNTIAVAQRTDWLTVNLDTKFSQSQKRVTAYLFKLEALAEVINTKEVHHVRFVLGYNNNIIQISAVGVDAKGNELVTVSSTVLFETQYDQQLTKLNSTIAKSITAKTVVSKHILTPKAAYSGIKGWQEKLVKVKDLNEVTSYSGERIHHYSLEKEVIQAMIQNSNIANVGLFLGLNNGGKLTTVFVGLNKENNIRSSSPTARDAADDIYDFTQPCPTACDTESPILQ
jgi:hypothetical protein